MPYFWLKVVRVVVDGQVMPYPSDLTDAQWGLLEPLLCPSSKRGPKHGGDLRRVVDAMLYVTHTGCQWRFLPDGFGKWTRVWSQFRRWSGNGTWSRVLAALHEHARMAEGRAEVRPSMVVIDPHLARGGSRGGLTFPDRGGPYGRTNGAKRVIAVDVTGLPLAARVVPASTAEQVCADVFECTSVDAATALKNWKESRTGARKGRQVGFPRLAAKHHSTPRFRLRSKAKAGASTQPVRCGGSKQLRLPTIGDVRVHGSTRRLRRMMDAGRFHPHSASVSYSKGRWWVSVQGVAAAAATGIDRLDVTYVTGALQQQRAYHAAIAGRCLHIS